jgi:hypothetical protein
VRLVRVREYVGKREDRLVCRCENTYSRRHDRPVGDATYQVLLRANGLTPLAELLADVDAETTSVVLLDVLDLWRERLIQLRPVVPTGVTVDCSGEFSRESYS